MPTLNKLAFLSFCPNNLSIQFHHVHARISYSILRFRLIGVLINDFKIVNHSY